MKYTIWGIALLFGILFISLASAWTINVFNNSLGAENFTILAGANVTRYLSIPSTTSYITNGVLGLMYPIGTLEFVSNLMAYYKMDEGSGTAVNDVVNGYNGTTNGGWTTSGLINNATTYDGSQVANISGVLNFGTNNATISLWVYFTDVTSFGDLISKRQGAAGGEDGYRILLDSATDIKYGLSGLPKTASLPAFTNNHWYHFVMRRNADNVSLWVNGTQYDSFNGTLTGGDPDQDNNFNVTIGGWSAGNIKGRIDEVGLWNRSLSDSEISQLYNSGLGVSYPQGNIGTLNISIGSVVMDSQIIGNFTNTTKTISGLQTQINSYLSSCVFISGFCNVPFVFKSTALTTIGYFNLNFNNVGFLENNQSYNLTTYETSSETFSINTTYDSSTYAIDGTLYYDGVSYAGTRSGTGNNAIFTRTIDVPNVISQTNKSFYWQISLNNGSIAYFNSTFKNQTVSNISFSLCGTTTPYLNITFKDETTQNVINATVPTFTWTGYLGSGTQTKTYNFLNATINPSYAFCFTPQNKIAHSTIAMTYASPGYPTRPYTVTTDLSNATTNTTLYLLGSADGIYSSIQVIQQSGGVISGVSILVEREINSVWTMVGQAVTDSSGLATFWVNPNYNHRYTASKVGYVTSIVTIKPTQSLYTLALVSVQGTAGYSSGIEGISWITFPASGRLTSLTTTNFNTTVTSSLGNLLGCIFNIVNATNNTQVLASTSGLTNSTYCFLSLDYNVRYNNKVFGQLGIRTTNTTGYVYVDTDWMWYNVKLNVSSWNTLTSFFRELQHTGEFGEGDQADFSRLMWFFLLTTIFVGIFTFFTGAEFTNPNALLIVILVIIFIASTAGIFTFPTGSSNINKIFGQYGIGIMLAEVVASIWIFNFRRASYG